MSRSTIFYLINIFILFYGCTSNKSDNQKEVIKESYTPHLGKVKVYYVRIVTTEIGEEFIGSSGSDTIVTLYEYPVIIGSSDSALQQKLNSYFAADTMELKETGSLISVKLLAATDSDYSSYSESAEITLINESIVSYEDNYYMPGGARPMVSNTTKTLDIQSLKPVFLSQLFLEGYKEVFKEQIKKQVPFDSSDLDMCEEPLQVSWIKAMEAQNDGKGIGFTDSTIYFIRDTESDFKCMHAGSEKMKISIPYRTLDEYIRSDGPLAQFKRK